MNEVTPNKTAEENKVTVPEDVDSRLMKDQQNFSAFVNGGTRELKSGRPEVLGVLIKALGQEKMNELRTQGRKLQLTQDLFLQALSDSLEQTMKSEEFQKTLLARVSEQLERAAANRIPLGRTSSGR